MKSHFLAVLMLKNLNFVQLEFRY